MIKTDSVFHGLSEMECEAVAFTEGIVFVCVFKTRLSFVIKSHIRFLTDVQQVPEEDISFSTGSFLKCRYTIVSLSSLSSYRELIELSISSKDKGQNLFCVGSPTEWTQLCKNIPIFYVPQDIHPNIAIDCTKNKPHFYQPKMSKEIHASRLLLTDIIMALANRKPPVLLFTETEHDYNYVRLFRSQYGSNGIICLNQLPEESKLRNASKVITIRNSRNQESVTGLMNFIENYQSMDNVHVILYTCFYEINDLLLNKLDDLGIHYCTITPAKTIGIPSIGAITLDVEQQMIECIRSLVYE